MKFTLLLLVIPCLQISASIKGQNVTLSLKNGSLKEILQQINEQTGYDFFFSDSFLKKAGKVTLELKDVPLEEALNQCFRNLSVDYEITENSIVLQHKKAKPEEKEIPVEQQPQGKEISGTVKDTKGLPVPGISVLVKGTTTGTVTDAEGKFTLSVPSDARELQFSFVGMRTQEVNIDGKTTFSVMMEEEMIGIDEVIAVGYGNILLY